MVILKEAVDGALDVGLRPRWWRKLHLKVRGLLAASSVFLLGCRGDRIAAGDAVSAGAGLCAGPALGLLWLPNLYKKLDAHAINREKDGLPS